MPPDKRNAARTRGGAPKDHVSRGGPRHVDPTTDPRQGPVHPPHLAAEAAVLGAALHGERFARGVVKNVDVNDFDRHAHRIVFEAIAALLEACTTPDTVTLTAHLADAGTLDEVGGPVAVFDLLAGVPEPPTWPAYASIVAAAAERRRKIAEHLAALRDLGVTVEVAA